MEMNRSMSVARMLLPVLFCLLSSCAQIPNAPVTLQFEAAKNLNVDISQSSLPVRIKIYQLSDATAFREATFRQIWKNDDNVLGQSLLFKKELTVNPGQTVSLKLQRRQGAEYIAVAGIFRQHGDNGWKSIKPLPGHVNSILGKIFISVADNQVEIR